MCPPAAGRFFCIFIEYSVFDSRTQAFFVLSAYERHYIFSCVYINTLTQYSRSTANCRLHPKIRSTLRPPPQDLNDLPIRIVGADAHIGPTDRTVFTAIFGESDGSQWVDVGIDPYTKSGIFLHKHEKSPGRWPGLSYIFDYSSSFAVQTICSSSSCFCVTSEGAPMRISCAFLFIGNGMISRMDSSPASSMTMRSTPGAIPA